MAVVAPNDVVGALAGKLSTASNLSDVPNKPAARVNLGAVADMTETTVSGSSGTLAAGAMSNVQANGTYAAPTPDATVGSPAKRYGLRASSTAGCTLTMPNINGTTLTLTLLAGEARTYRQITNSGYALESGIPLAGLDSRYNTHTELAYAENATGVATAIAGNLTYTQIPGTGIVVPVTPGPVLIEYEGYINVTTAGGGLCYLALMEIPAGGGTPVTVKSISTPATASNSGTGSATLGTLHGLAHFPNITTVRTFCLSGVNILDSSSSLASNFGNSPFNPTYIRAEAA